MTSAAVFDSTGAMVRALWAGVSYSPGTYRMTWDGMLQDGTPAPFEATYTIKLLRNNVTYTWDGKIRTTETNWFNRNNYTVFGWNSADPTYLWVSQHTFAFVGNKGVFGTGYAEQRFNIGFFDGGDPNTPVSINSTYHSNGIYIYDLATDGAWVYLMNTGNGDSSYITALDAGTGQPVQFPSGTAVAGVWKGNSLSCIDFAPNSAWYDAVLSSRFPDRS